MLSRRSMFGASAAAIIASVPVVSVAAPSADAALLELGRQDEQLYAAYQAAQRVTTAAYERYTAQRPQPSGVLIATKDDETRFHQRELKAGEPIDGVTVVYLKESLPRLEGGALFHPGKEYRPLTRAKEIIAAHDKLLEDDAKVSRRVGLEQAGEAEDEAYDRLSENEIKIRDARCHTLEGAKIKARVASRYRNATPDFAGEVAMGIVDLILNGGLN